MPESTTRGIILAGGSGTRLHPLTKIVCKQLLPVYDKPMIYYPLSVLMLGGIREALIISTPKDLPQFRALFGDGSQFGLRIDYAEQPSPDGIAQAFLIGADFIADAARTCLILGDNLFYGRLDFFRNALQIDDGGCVFGYRVRDPERFGVPEIDGDRIVRIEEKPKKPKSQYAVTGVYMYDETVFDKIKTLDRSARGELEITDVNNMYIEENTMTWAKLEGWWTDAGTIDSLRRATNLVAETGANNT